MLEGCELPPGNFSVSRLFPFPVSRVIVLNLDHMNKKIIFGIFIATVAFSSCRNNFNTTTSNENEIYTFPNVCLDTLYPKGIIPKWLKDTLSEEQYNFIYKLSQKYEMSYYPISPNNHALHEKSNLKEKIEIGGNIITGGGHIIEGGNLGYQNSIKLYCQTHTIYETQWDSSMLLVNMNVIYEHHPSREIATIRTINVNTKCHNSNFNAYWQTRSREEKIVNNGKTLDLHINGYLKTSLEIEGLIGIDLIITSINKTFNLPVELKLNDD